MTFQDVGNGQNAYKSVFTNHHTLPFMESASLRSSEASFTKPARLMSLEVGPIGESPGIGSPHK